MSTIAHRIADKMGGDGSSFRLFGVVEKVAVKVESKENAHRYVFGDGSAIVENGACWDVEGSEPFSMECAE